MDFCDLVVIGVGRASTVVLSAVNRYSAGEKMAGRLGGEVLLRIG